MLLKFIVQPGHPKLAASLSRAAVGGATLLAVLLTTRAPLHAQTLYVAKSSTNTVGAYDATTATTRSSFTSPTGLSAPDGLLVSGNNLYVSNNQGNNVSLLNATSGAVVVGFTLNTTSPVGLALFGSNLYVTSTTTTNSVNTGSISVYNATTGGAPTSTLSLSGLKNPQGLTMAGSILYYADADTGTIGAYNTAAGSAGAVTGFTAPSGLSTPIFLALSSDGKDLFVANQGSGTVGEYNAADGTAIKTSFVAGLMSPRGLAVSGDILYVSSFTSTGTVVSEYNISADTLKSSSFLTNDGANGLAISPVPEPATWLGGALLGLVAIKGARRFRRGQRA